MTVAVFEGTEFVRIAFVASTYPRFPGDGAGRFVLSMAEAVTSLGHEVHVVAPYHPAVAPTPGPVIVHHFRYIWPDAWAIMGYAQAMESDKSLRKGAYLLAPLYFLFGLLKLMTLARRKKLDAIHAHWVVPNAPLAALVARWLGVPLVISLHGSDIFMALGNPILRPIARWAFGQAALITACSPDLLEGALKLGAPASRTRLVPWGADPDIFHPELDGSAMRRAWGIPADATVAASLGRLVRKKGLSVLVRAIPAVLERVPDAYFVVAGEGPELAELQSMAQQLGVAERVIFPGPLAWPQVPQFLAAATLFVVPSVHDEKGNVDGLPTTILEAMAAGKPVVASDVAGISLAVTHGESGLLVPEGDTDALAAALISVLADPERVIALGHAGRRRVETELNWRQVAGILEAGYSQSKNGD